MARDAERSWRERLEALLAFLILALQIGEARLGFLYRAAQLLGAFFGLVMVGFGGGGASGMRGNRGFEFLQRLAADRFRGRGAFRGFLGLQRFGVAADRVFAEAHRGAAQFVDMRVELGLFVGAASGALGDFAQIVFQRGGLLAQALDRFAVAQDARVDFGFLVFGALGFELQALGAGFDLRALFALEGDAIFRAVELEGGLAEELIGLAQLGVEFVDPGAQAFLLGFALVQRAGAAFFACGKIADEDFEAFGFGVEMARFACQHFAQQGAHFFA